MTGTAAQRLLLPLLVVATMMAGPALAWGPVAHAVFNCLALYPNVPVADCVSGANPLPAYGVLAASSDLPDAFGFGAFDIEKENTPQALCSNLTYVHDPVFGATMIDSLADGQIFDPTTPLPPKMAMARGFLGHIVGDLVGFNPAGGILCTAQSGGCTASTMIYMPEWSYMAALDAALWVRHNLTGMAVVGADMASFDAFNFLANASSSYASSTPTFGAFSAASAQACATYWSNNAAFIARRATFIAATPSARVALSDEISWFLPKKLTGSTWQQWLDKQTDCAVQAIQYITAELPYVPPAEAWGDVAKFVAGLYAKGTCTVA